MTQILHDEQQLRELCRQCLHHDIAPIFLNHCLSGDPPRVYAVLKPLFDECVEQLSSLSLQELGLTVESIPPGFRMMVDPVDSSMRPEYIERVAHYLLATELENARSPMIGVVEAIPDNSEVLENCPELRSQLDKDGLLKLSDEMVLFDAGVKYREHFFYVHQLLRRGFASSPNFDFIGRLAAYRRSTSDVNSFRIAVDHRRTMLFDDWRQHIERDRWYGPQFDDDKLDDPNHFGLAVVGREYPTSLDQYPLIRTEFLWKRNEGNGDEHIKTLEVEELTCPSAPRENLHINRYAHAERDMSRKIFRHFDGAAKVYRKNDYASRVGSNMPHNTRPAHYLKLFRIDGELKLEDWISLLSMFYKGNEMVVEYFDPKLFQSQILPQRRQLGEALAKGK